MYPCAVLDQCGVAHREIENGLITDVCRAIRRTGHSGAHERSAAAADAAASAAAARRRRAVGHEAFTSGARADAFGAPSGSRSSPAAAAMATDVLIAASAASSRRTRRRGGFSGCGISNSSNVRVRRSFGAVARRGRCELSARGRGTKWRGAARFDASGVCEAAVRETPPLSERNCVCRRVAKWH